MAYKITVLPGDGVGPEVTAQAVLVLEAAGAKHGFALEFTTALIGGIAIDETGSPLPGETVELCKNSDGVILGAVGGPKWDSLPGE
ncbi:MAG: isocitrate/isopropylmalate family dehydrogenase, partial [Oscillospiraceae bacterium]|nr:isocitrate/isopropylmalate family dehydrogenase [Oscillospiraceae bacterium]